MRRCLLAMTKRYSFTNDFSLLLPLLLVSKHAKEFNDEEKLYLRPLYKKRHIKVNLRRWFESKINFDRRNIFSKNSVTTPP